MPDGNFEDYVVVSQDTLSHRGASLQIGTTSASTVGIGLSNSGGMLNLEAAPTGNGTVFFPTSGGTLLTNIGMSAGTSTTLASAFSFVNGNNVTWRLSSNSISAIVNSSLTAVNFSAGTTNTNVSQIVFSNSNGVSFGLNGSTITGSVATSLTNINVSAGTTSNNLSAVTFSNSNGVSFGLNGSTLTGSVATSLTNINVSAGTTSNNLSAITFSNSNGITFGLNGSTVTASVNAAGGGGAPAVAAGTQTATSGTVIFSNSNGVTFGMSGSATVTASVQFGLTGLSSWQPGAPVTSYAWSGLSATSNQAIMSLQPFVIDRNLTATHVVWLWSINQAFNTITGGFSVSLGLYSINGSTLSLASSASSLLSWTTGGQLSSSTGINYQNMNIGTWNITPGVYVLASWVSAMNSTITSAAPEASFWGTATVQPSATAMGSAFTYTNQIFPGFSVSSNTSLPGSIAVSNTSGWNRSHTGASQQAWFLLQGT